MRMPPAAGAGEREDDELGDGASPSASEQVRDIRLIVRACLRLAGAVGVAPDGTFCAGEGRPFLADVLLQDRGSCK
jgi:hypothetical protein